MTFSEGRHLDGVVNDKGGLNIFPFGLLAENLIYQLPFTHRLVLLYTQFITHLSQLRFIHSTDIDAGMFFYSVNHRHPWVGSLEIDDSIAYFCLGGAQHL